MLDSGAMDTMSGKSDVFDPNSVTENNVSINGANRNRSLFPSQSGDINATFLDREMKRDLVLKDVLHVPNIRTNLLSIIKLMKAGYTVIFQAEEASVVKDRVGKLEYDLVRVRVFVTDGSIDATSYAFVMVAKQMAELWHKRISHLSLTHLKLMVMATQGMKFNDFSCLKDQICAVSWRQKLNK